jgi:hypothetical protein
LDALSRERLDELIQNELEFRTFTNQLDIIQQYNEIQQQQLNKNVSIAKSNLQYESEIQQLYDDITKLSAELHAKVQAFQELEQQQDAIIQPPPVSKMVRELTKAKKEAYQQSEQIAEHWLQQQQQQQQQQSSSLLSVSTMDESTAGSHHGSTIPTFIETFQAIRKLQHVRAAKLELVQQPPSSSQVPRNNGDTTSNNFYYTL